MDLISIAKEILSHQKIAIFSHQKCDGDAVGSCIALKLALEKLNKEVDIFIQQPIPKNFAFMETEKHLNKGGSKKFDLAISLDCPNTKRFGLYEKKFKSIRRSVALDHHADCENFANVNCCEEYSSSTCLIVFKLIKIMGVEFDTNIATCLYTGMATDTGRFNHGHMNSELFEAVGELFKFNFDFEKINYILFKKQTKNEFELTKIALNKLKLFESDKIAIVQLVNEDFVKTGTTPFDTHRIIDMITGIDTVKIACVLSQNNGNEFLVSVRSIDNFSAQNVAKEFGGGGHIKASGCKIFENPQSAFKLLLEACKNEISRVKQS